MLRRMLLALSMMWILSACAGAAAPAAVPPQVAISAQEAAQLIEAAKATMITGGSYLLTVAPETAVAVTAGLIAADMGAEAANNCNNSGGQPYIPPMSANPEVMGGNVSQVGCTPAKTVCSEKLRNASRELSKFTKVDLSKPKQGYLYWAYFDSSKNFVGSIEYIIMKGVVNGQDQAFMTMAANIAPEYAGKYYASALVVDGAREYRSIVRQIGLSDQEIDQIPVLWVEVNGLPYKCVWYELTNTAEPTEFVDFAGRVPKFKLP